MSNQQHTPGPWKYSTPKPTSIIALAKYWEKRAEQLGDGGGEHYALEACAEQLRIVYADHAARINALEGKDPEKLGALEEVAREADTLSQNVAELLNEYAPIDAWAGDLLVQMNELGAKSRAALDAFNREA